MEDNIIEVRQAYCYEYGRPVAIEILDNNLIVQPPPYTHGEVVVRGNTVRLVDGIPGPLMLFAGSYGPVPFAADGIAVAGAKKTLVYDNIIDVPAASPSTQVRDYRCGAVGYVNNRTAAGALAQGLGVIQDLPPGSFTIIPRTDLEIEIDDAALMSI